MSLLRIENLNVDLGGRPVVTDVSLDIAAGELVGLIGPNGAGKTTTMRAVLGLVRARSGRALIDGQRVRRGRIGYVPQRHEFAWDFPVDVLDVVASGLTGTRRLGARPREAEWKRVAEALERVQMSHLRSRPVGELSGGQRQRVLVARALALGSPVLLLDEPFTGLDMPTQDLLIDLLGDLAHEGRAVLMTTHDLLGAMDACDRLALINRRLIAVGRPSELAEQPERWSEAFGVGDSSPLLRVLKAVL